MDAIFAQATSNPLEKSRDKFTLRHLNYSDQLNVALDKITKSTIQTASLRSVDEFEIVDNQSENNQFDMEFSMPIYTPKSLDEMVVFQPDTTKNYTLLIKTPE
jgi:hypothetical protein